MKPSVFFGFILFVSVFLSSSVSYPVPSHDYHLKLEKAFPWTFDGPIDLRYSLPDKKDIEDDEYFVDPEPDHSEEAQEKKKCKKSELLYVGERKGKIWVFPNCDEKYQDEFVDEEGFFTEDDGDMKDKKKVFLDISDRLEVEGEMGLLGFAFHPDFPKNPHVYLSYVRRENKGDLEDDDEYLDEEDVYTEPGEVDEEIVEKLKKGKSIIHYISKFKVNSRKEADKKSEKIIMKFYKPSIYHQGGSIFFGKHDRYLYISLGDGKRPKEAQNPYSYLGKILRIDVDLKEKDRDASPDELEFEEGLPSEEEAYYNDIDVEDVAEATIAIEIEAFEEEAEAEMEEADEHESYEDEVEELNDGEEEEVEVEVDEEGEGIDEFDEEEEEEQILDDEEEGEEEGMTTEDYEEDYEEDEDLNDKWYGIPKGNAYPNGGGYPEIFALGFRNPWRCSSDDLVGVRTEMQEVWCGDIGDKSWEEVNLIQSGKNYGWPFMEGYWCWEDIHCNLLGQYELPFYAYPHPGILNRDEEVELSQEEREQDNSNDKRIHFPPAKLHFPFNGSAIIGGYVYQGSRIPWLKNGFIFGDYVGQKMGAFFYKDTEVRWVTEIVTSEEFDRPPNAFGVDSENEFYILTGGRDRPIYKFGSWP